MSIMGMGLINLTSFISKTGSIFILFILCLSCQTKKESYELEIAQLRKSNDSLTMILNEINNTKYVFDSIAFRDIPHPDNTLKLNSNYRLELLVVGYSPNKDYFIKYDSIVNNKKINPDTLFQKNGGFSFKTKLEKKHTPIYIDMNIDNDYGKTRKSMLYDVIEVQ